MGTTRTIRVSEVTPPFHPGAVSRLPTFSVRLPFGNKSCCMSHCIEHGARILIRGWQHCLPTLALSYTKKAGVLSSSICVPNYEAMQS